MVGMQIVFGNCEQQTPHGGQPFHYWKKGYGFGHTKGPGEGNCLDPASAVQLRFTPKADRGLASNRFWRGKWECGQAMSFGIGDRPDYGSQNKVCGPDNYGDVSKRLSAVKRSAIRPNIELKPRFPSAEEKARDYSWPSSGPGPGKYNLASHKPGRCHSFSFGIRGEESGELKESLRKPGPGYSVAVKCGRNSPILHGTLYNISMHGKVKRISVGEASPGPAKYTIKGQLEEQNLWGKISNVQKPPFGYWRTKQPLTPSLGGRPLEESVSEPTRYLTRVESSPAQLDLAA